MSQWGGARHGSGRKPMNPEQRKVRKEARRLAAAEQLIASARAVGEAAGMGAPDTARAQKNAPASRAATRRRDRKVQKSLTRAQKAASRLNRQTDTTQPHLAAGARPGPQVPGKSGIPRLSIQDIKDILELSERRGRGRMKRKPESSPFLPALHPPEAMPAKDLQMAMDSAPQQWATNSWMQSAQFSTFVEGMLFLGYPVLAEMAQRPEYRVISETIATECTREWIKFSTRTGADEKAKPGDDENQGDLDAEAEGDEQDADEEQDDGQAGPDGAPKPKPGQAQDDLCDDLVKVLEQVDSDGDGEVETSEVDEAAEAEKDSTLETGTPDAELDGDSEGNEAEGAALEEGELPVEGGPADELGDLDGDGDVDEDDAKIEGNEKTKKIEELVDFLDKLQLRERCAELICQDGFFGRSHLFLDFGQGCERNNPELKTPIGSGRDAISKSKVAKGMTLRLQTVEAVWTYPMNYNANNPLAPDWYNPQYWYVMGTEIHASRLLTFVGHPVPDLLKPAYSFGGLSLTQMAKPYVDIWLQTRESVAALIHSFSTMVLATDLATLLQPGGAADLMARAELFNYLRDNQSLMMINKTTEEFSNVSASLSGLHELQAQAQEHMASVSRIPLVKLLGIQPAGLNASSEGEIRVFYDTIKAYQNAFLRPNITRVIDFAQICLWGEIDDDIVFDFEELWSMTEKERSEARKADAETHTIYTDAGIIDPGEVRVVLAADPDSPYQGIDPEAVPEPPEPEMPPGMGGMMPGAGGPPGANGKQPPGKAGPPKPAATKPPPGGAQDRRPFAADDAGKFEESKHPRDADGKFGSGGGGGGGGASSEQPKAFKSKSEHAASLLAKGVTTKDMLKALGWPSISMPAMAKTVGMKLEKTKVNGETVYKGTLMTDAEKAAVKAEAQAAKVKAKAAPAPVAAAPAPTPAAPSGAQPTAAELEKAKKTIKLEPHNMPGYTGLSQPESLEAAKMMVNGFNTTYANKAVTDPADLAKKVNHFKSIVSAIGKLQEKDQVVTAAQQKAEAAALAEQAKKDAAEYDEKVKAAKAAGIIKGELTAQGKSLIAQYTGSSYKALNKQIRDNKMTKASYNFMKGLNEALDAMPPYTQKTYRKATLTAAQAALYEPGYVVTERAFTSTAKHAGVWSGSYHYEIEGKTGRDIQNMSFHHGEAEVLFKANTHFEVMKRDGNKIYLRELD